ncbi:MAG: ABC transporter permease [Candidatus Contubernalis sp.]|nr:ABC transporter permease [Candidatus Contubernalis sp.]
MWNRSLSMSYIKKVGAMVLAMLWLRKKRSLLAAAGIFVGVAAVITLMSLGGSTRLQILQEIEKLGTNQLIIEAAREIRPTSERGGGGSSSPGGGSLAQTLTVEDSEELSSLPEVKYSLPVFKQEMVDINVGSNVYITTIFSASPEFTEVFNFYPERGTFFSSEEDDAASSVAVLGRTVALELFGSLDVVGLQVHINNVPFEVKGILEEKGTDMEGEDLDDLVVIPLTTGIRKVFGEEYLTHIYLYVESVDFFEDISLLAAEVLRENHNLESGDEDDFKILNRLELVETHSMVGDTLEVLITILVVITFLAGGVGIMAIMLMSLKERSWEIGLRRSLGAAHLDIFVQFLMEALYLGLAGGLGGIAAGVVISLTVSIVMGLPIFVSFSAVIFSFLASISLGLVFGVYPALIASHLDPAIALRSK